MILREIEIKGYRSLRDLYLRPQRVCVLVGANGVGKTNLYRALHLLQAAANGRLGRTIAAEGTLSSVFWAGKQRNRKSPRLSITATFDVYQYSLALGFPEEALSHVTFPSDPVVKNEAMRLKVGTRFTDLAKRNHGNTQVRDSDGDWQTTEPELPFSESMLGELREPDRFPQLWQLHDEFARWRFYHSFPTDDGARIRQPTPATYTPVVAPDGADMAAALMTILASSHQQERCRETLADAFPEATISTQTIGTHIVIDPPKAPRIAGTHIVPSYESRAISRKFGPLEMSDGTLRFLCLLTALLSPKPPPLLVLNEPETSLHPDLLPPLARLINRAAESVQVLLTTHSEPLAAAIEHETGIPPLRLMRDKDGATSVSGGEPSAHKGFTIRDPDEDDDH